jgi:exodeoxyribonuclease VII small subunit
VTRKKPEPFEDALKKLEKIVERLERGSLPLEEAMEAFTEGVRLVKVCNQKLDEAENSVQMLVKNGPGSWLTTPFEPTATGGEKAAASASEASSQEDIVKY